MSRKKKIRMASDLLMVFLLPVLMAYSLVGEAAHEWFGIVMFLLFLLHHVLNIQWLKNILKGRYTPVRIIGTAVNLLLAVVMFLLPISGLLMARHIDFFEISFGVSCARLVHLTVSYWGFVLMSIHLGIHWNMISGMLKKLWRSKGRQPGNRWLKQVVVILLVGYGSYAFVRRRFPTYLFLKSQFVFFNFEEPLLFFFFDYIMILFLFAAVGFGISKLCMKKEERKQCKKNCQLPNGRD